MSAVQRISTSVESSSPDIAGSPNLKDKSAVRNRAGRASSSTKRNSTKKRSKKKKKKACKFKLRVGKRKGHHLIPDLETAMINASFCVVCGDFVEAKRVADANVSQVALLTQKLAEREEALLEAAVRKQDQEARLEALVAEVGNLTKEVNARNKELAEWEKRKRTADGASEKLGLHVTNLEKEIARLSLDYTSMELTNGNLHAENEELTKEKKSLQAQLKACRDLNVQLSDAYAEQTKLLNQEKSTNESKSHEIKDLIGSINDLRKEHARDVSARIVGMEKQLQAQSLLLEQRNHFAFQKWNEAEALRDGGRASRGDTL